MHADPIGRPLVLQSTTQQVRRRPDATSVCPKRLMRCQLLGQLEHVLGRPFRYVVLPRPDTSLGWLTALRG